MKQRIELTESELIKLIESTARECIIEREKSIDKGFDYKVNKVTKRYGKLFEKYDNASKEEKFEAFKNETVRLLEHGYTDIILGEALTKHTSLLSEGIELGTGSFSWIREGLWGWVLGFLGVGEGPLRKALVISLGNVPFTDIPKLFKCDYLISVLSEGVKEFMLYKVTDMFQEGEPGKMMGLVRNIVGDTVQSTEMNKRIEKYLKETVCGALGGKKDQVSKLFSDDKKEKEEFKPPSGSDPKGGSWYDDLVQQVMSSITKGATA